MPLTELHVPCDLGGHGDLGGHVPRDLGGHVPKVEVVGDHRIVSNQRVRLGCGGSGCGVQVQRLSC